MDAREFRTTLRHRIEALLSEETENLVNQVEGDFKAHRGHGTLARAMRMKGLREAVEIADEIIKETYGSPTPGKA